MMKHILYILLVVLTVSGCVWSQGSAPTAPSSWGWDNIGINAMSKVGTGIAATNVYLRVRNGGGTIDTLFYFPRSIAGSYPSYIVGSGWWLGVAGAPFNNIFGDTMSLSAGGRFRLNSEYFSDLTGSGLTNNGGALDAVLGSTIDGSEITNQTILKQDIDTTTTLTMVQYFKGNGAVADSELVTVNFSDSLKYFVGSKPVMRGNPTDQYVLTYSDGLDSLIWQAAPGAGSGDDIRIDTGAADANVWDNPTGTVLRFTGATVSIVGTDTAAIAISAANSISVDGDTVTADKRWRFPNGYLDSLYSVDADFIRADSVLRVGNETAPNYPTYIDDTSIMYLRRIEGDNIGTSQGRDLRIVTSTLGTDASTTTGTSDIYLTTNDKLYIGTSATPTKFYCDMDSLVGTGMVTKGWKSASVDSLIVGGTVFRGSDTATGIASRRTVSDSLANFVRIANENLRDSGSVGNDWMVQGVGATNALHIKQDIVTGDDTTRLYNGDGTTAGMGAMEIRGKAVKLTGGAGSTVFGSTTQFNATVNHQGQDIDSVRKIDVDTIQVDHVVRFNGSVTPTTYIGLKAPTAPTTTVFTLPSADGASGQVLSTNGSGTMSWATVTGGTGGGFPIGVNTDVAGNRTDSFLIVGKQGVSATISVQDATTNWDTVSIVADTTTMLSTRGFAIKTANDTALSRATLDDEWKHDGTMSATVGSDSVWMPSATAGVRALNITAKHTGGDSTFIKPDAGGGLVIGKGGSGSVTVLDADTTRLKGTAKLRFGGQSAVTLDSALVDSMVNQEGVYATGAGGTGDITAVGSMTTGAPFSDGTADGDWLGLGATGGRIDFNADGAGVDDDYVGIPTGSLVLGTTLLSTHNGIYMFKGSAGNIETEFINVDSTNSSGMWGYYGAYSRTDGSVGGDAGISYAITLGSAGASDVRYYEGIDRSDSFAYKLQLSDDFGVVANGLELDSSGNTRFNGPVYNRTVTADSALATVGLVKARIPYYNTARDIVWNYPTADADTSMHATFPYTTVYDTTHLVKVSTTTGNDTAFGCVIPFYISDSVTVDSFVFWVATSSATADSSKVDSLHITYEGADVAAVVALTSDATDRVGTTFTRYAVGLSRSATPGEIIRVRPSVVLKQDESYVTIHKAQIKGSKRS